MKDFDPLSENVMNLGWMISTASHIDVVQQFMSPSLHNPCGDLCLVPSQSRIKKLKPALKEADCGEKGMTRM